MKIYIKLILFAIIIVFAFSCSENNANESNAISSTYVKLAVSGSVVNINQDEFKIIEEELNEDDFFIDGHIYNEELNEETQKVASLFFSRFFGAEPEELIHTITREFDYNIPAE